MLKRLAAWASMLIFHPAEGPELDADAEPLEGLAGEARLLLTAYDGLIGRVPIEDQFGRHPLLAKSIAEIEALLDGGERGRWMHDANDWAVRARRATKDSEDPYRADPAPDTRLRDAGERVWAAVRDDSIAEAAGALAKYLDHIRNDPTLRR